MATKNPKVEIKRGGFVTGLTILGIFIFLMLLLQVNAVAEPVAKAIGVDKDELQRQAGTGLMLSLGVLLIWLGVKLLVFPWLGVFVALAGLGLVIISSVRIFNDFFAESGQRIRGSEI